MKVKGHITRIEKDDIDYPDGNYSEWVELKIIIPVFQSPFFKDKAKEKKEHNIEVSKLKLGTCEVIQNANL